MKVLLIGAGAVGQVYGYHFQRGGAEVSFFVRQKYAEATRQGFDLYPMNRKRPREAPLRFEGFGVLTDMGEVAAASWDAVVLCLSSTALRKGSWLGELVEAMGDATLVNLTPGIEDHTLITSLLPEQQVVSGLIGISSYPGPLDGETLPSPGMVYWVPPMTKMAFSGPEQRTREVVEALNAGGLKSKVVADVQATSAFAGPVLQFQMVALELSAWTFKGLRGDKALMRLTHQATREAFTIASKRLNKKVPLSLRMLRPWMLRLVTRLMPRVAPIDMERFFEKHFSKVGDQTEHGMTTWIELADRFGAPSEAIAALLTRLRAQRGEALPGEQADKLAATG